MPDVFSTSLVLIAIYFGLSFFNNKKNWHLILYFVFIMFGLLSKLPAFVMIGLLVPVIFESRFNLKRKLLFIVTSIVALIPVVWWYFYWTPRLTADYGFFYFFMGSDIRTSFGFLISEWRTVFRCFYFDVIGYVGFVFCLMGMIYLIIKKERKLLFALGGVFVLH